VVKGSEGEFTMKRSMAILGVTVLAAAALQAPSHATAGMGAISEYAIPTAGSQPVSIVNGPDGAVWFTEFAGNKIGRLGADGTFTEYPIPTPGAQADDMAVGPDGNLWFAETAGNKIGRITTAGVIDEFDGLPPASRPTAVAAGADGNVWFTERALSAPSGRIGSITPTGVITTYQLPSNGHPLTIAAGSDGALWFTESPGNRIGRIDPATGVISEFPVPTFQSAPWEITGGPDGNLWFTELLGNKIGRIDPATGVITEFPLPTPASQPNTIRPGTDPNPADVCAFQHDALGDAAFFARYGNFGGCVSALSTTRTLWFTEQAANRVAQISTDGQIFEFPLPTAGSQPGGITQSSDGDMWFTEFAGNAIARLQLRGVGEPAPPTTQTP
jgi:virginiamycin B lyase